MAEAELKRQEAENAQQAMQESRLANFSKLFTARVGAEIWEWINKNPDLLGKYIEDLLSLTGMNSNINNVRQEHQVALIKACYWAGDKFFTSFNDTSVV